MGFIFFKTVGQVRKVKSMFYLCIYIIYTIFRVNQEDKLPIHPLEIIGVCMFSYIN